MKKITGFTLLITCIALLFGACNNDMSYSDYVKRERKRIDGFIAEQNIVVLNEYPSDGVFKANEFFLDNSTGVYFNVVDSGNGLKPQNRDIVYYRFIGVSQLPLSESDTLSLSQINNSYYLADQPLSLTYGVTTTYTSASTSVPNYAYSSLGITVPLKYVGEGAVVNMIIPFKNNVGSTYQTNTYSTMYFQKVIYTSIVN